MGIGSIVRGGRGNESPPWQVSPHPFSQELHPGSLRAAVSAYPPLATEPSSVGASCEEKKIVSDEEFGCF
jgi:hypothetical protein